MHMQCSGHMLFGTGIVRLSFVLNCILNIPIIVHSHLLRGNILYLHMTFVCCTYAWFSVFMAFVCTYMLYRSWHVSYSFL
jgi:hypothetical protein